MNTNKFTITYKTSDLCVYIHGRSVIDILTRKEYLLFSIDMDSAEKRLLFISGLTFEEKNSLRFYDLRKKAIFNCFNMRVRVNSKSDMKKLIDIITIAYKPIEIFYDKNLIDEFFK